MKISLSLFVPVFPRKVLLPALLCTLLGSGGCGQAPETPEAPKTLAGAARGWNVVLLSIDTLRADRLNSYGYDLRETSPNLDAVLGAGVRFEQAMAPRSLTWPALASVLTGLYPSGHGIIDNGYSFPDDLLTLPKVLQSAGYRTGAYLSNMCHANHQGWESMACSGGQDGKTVSRALEWLGEVTGEARENDGGEEARPFFLWVHLFGAHSPYYNGGDLAKTQLDPDYQGDLVAKKWRLNAVMENQEVLDEADVRHLDAIYDAAVIGSDRLAGRVLDGLAELGLQENTVVIVLADHGEDLYRHHGYLYHACSVYQSSLHVPFGITAPGILPGGASVPQAVELIDVAPTLLELLGLPALPEVHGVSLRPYLERPGQGGTGKPAFSEYGETRIHTVLADGWTLVENPQGVTPACFAGAPPDFYQLETTELYRLGDDPEEQTNLAADHPDRVRDLRALLSRRFAQLSRRAQPQDVPEELKEELRSLGYVAD